MKPELPVMAIRMGASFSCCGDMTARTISGDQAALPTSLPASFISFSFCMPRYFQLFTVDTGTPSDSAAS